ncbi:MAG: YitT family protein [Clostridia bacterium]|nr:YitT family protein [Clostridia bacterium]
MKLKTFLFMTFGCLMLSAGVYFFKIPNGFSTGGVTGVSTVLSSFTPISATIWIAIFNGSFLILGFLFLGKATGIWTVYCSMLFSGLTYLLEKIVPLDKPLTNYPLLELIYAMLLAAIGNAIMFNCGVSSGGTSILALILKKYTSMDVGKALLIVDFLIAASSIIVFGIEIGLFSMLGLFANAFIIDAVIDNLNVCKYFIVITNKREEISAYIMEMLNHGVTVGAVTGEYTKEEKYMIHTVCKRIEAIHLRNKIKEIDPQSFVIVTSTSEIIGRGFRNV